MFGQVELAEANSERGKMRGIVDDVLRPGVSFFVPVNSASSAIL